ncbi:hypothetical protein GDO81_022982 [Engystomops pustulosus]|uniref:Uncharacterized protein n=1 Tax=Engystomops pustulosus TaxID=76066 RepID=A0AAV6Z3K8_ENGPU|nr:hypothetical protein GDO81_022982 [Engystomops pustulosus]
MRQVSLTVHATNGKNNDNKKQHTTIQRHKANIEAKDQHEIQGIQSDTHSNHIQELYRYQTFILQGSYPRLLIFSIQFTYSIWK